MPFKRSLILLSLLLLASPAWCRSELALTLPEAEKLSLQNSDNLKSLESATESSQRGARATQAGLYPRISIDGYYYNNSVLPEQTLGPLGSITFGAHNNYGVGPMISYNVFDGGKLRKNYDGSLSLAKSKSYDEKAKKKLLLYQTRLAYFQLQYAVRSLIFTTASLKLSESQGRDISNRYKAGASSKLDYISAQKEILNFKMRYKIAQKDLSSSTRDLLALIKVENEYDSSAPIPNELVKTVPADLGEPTLVLRFDDIEKTVKELQSFATQPEPENHPELETLNELKKASLFSADSSHAGFYPNISIYAKTIYMYPNVVIKEKIWQNTFGVNLNFPIFEGDLTRNQTARDKAQAMSYEYQRKQRSTDLRKDWIKINDSLKNLILQEKLARQERDAAREIRKLTFDSYLNGKSLYLDVQNTNLRELDSELSVTQIESQILSQYAALNYLAED